MKVKKNRTKERSNDRDHERSKEREVHERSKEREIRERDAGASANVVCAGVAEQHGYKFTFNQFFK